MCFKTGKVTKERILLKIKFPFIMKDISTLLSLSDRSNKQKYKLNLDILKTKIKLDLPKVKYKNLNHKIRKYTSFSSTCNFSKYYVLGPKIY